MVFICSFLYLAFALLVDYHRKGEEMYITYYKSPIGRILIMTDETALLGLWLEGQKYYGAGYDLEQAQQEVRRLAIQIFYESYKPSMVRLVRPEQSEVRLGIILFLF